MTGGCAPTSVDLLYILMKHAHLLLVVACSFTCLWLAVMLVSATFIPTPLRLRDSLAASGPRNRLQNDVVSFNLGG